MPPSLSPAFKGPAIVIGVGVGFALLGTLPLAITLSMGQKGIAGVIGMGFIGFGLMLIIPGVCWCLIAQRGTYSRWRARHRTQEEIPALSKLTANGLAEDEGSDGEGGSSPSERRR